MQTVDTRFEAIQRRIAEEEIAVQVEQIATGQLDSFEAYKFKCGVIAGMRAVLGYSDEVNKKLEER
jgi:hypothetical protein